MIPLRDLLPTRSRPVVTFAIIGLNVAVFLMQLLVGSVDGERLVQRFGVIPAVLTSMDVFRANSLGGAMGALITPFTSMFLHGGVMHILGNMWFLWIFGDNVEDELGRGRFVAFYLLGGLCAALLQVASDPSSTTPMIGASGAISCVLAGYVLLHPQARVVTLVPIFIVLTTIEVPAFAFIFVWFGMQLLAGFGSLVMVSHSGGVAWWAHVGGFVAGLLTVRLFLPSQREPRWEHRPRRREPDRSRYYD